MSPLMATQKPAVALERTRRTYLIEALLIFVALLVVAALAMAAFAHGFAQSAQTQRQQRGMVLAQNTAEQFMANPLRVPYHSAEDGFEVICEVEATEGVVGTMYEAQIRVNAEGEDVVWLTTTRYVSSQEAPTLQEAARA